MNFEQQMAHMTTRLVVQKADGLHFGTGFFLGYDVGGGRSQIYCVTNRHVLANAQVCSVPITIGTAEGTPNFGQKVLIDVTDIASATIFHPDQNVDLAAFPATGLLNSMVSRGLTPFIRALARTDIPAEDFYSEIGLADDVLMVGYPNGLFDEENNMPILRRGITATLPGLKFNGRAQFVIDCACFPGSSGSPVFLHQPMGFRRPNGDMIMGGGRSVLLGILFAGPQVSVSGKITPVTIPTATTALSVQSMTMMHLGYCVRSTEIRFLDPHVSLGAANPG